VRVALLSRAAHPLHPEGGLERAVYHLAKHLQAQGVETVLLTRPATRDGSFPGEVVTVRYESVRAGRHGRVLDRTLNYPRFALRLGEVAAALVRAGRVDLVHAQGLTALGYGRLRRRNPLLRAPLVMNPQGMEEHKASGLKRLALARLRALSREAARLADRVLATDEATREEVPRHLGVEASKVAVLPNGIDPAEIRDATPADPASVAYAAIPALAEAPLVVLSVGRLEAYKGFADIADALDLLERRGSLPRGWAWVVVGEGPLRASLARRGIPNVHLLGRAEETLLHALYEAADVFVHASRYEGSSLVTLEAMAHGLPVAATRAGGIPDKVLDGETGLLAEPGDVPGLAGAIEELARDPARRDAMGERGRRRAEAFFSWPAIAARTVALYEELLRAAR
jgi:glycosyltransferase involved in cell wall biosynthesis